MKDARRRSSTRIRVASFAPSFHAHWERASGPEWLLVLVIVAAPLAIGGVHLVTRIALASLVFTAFAWAALRLHRAERKVRIGLMGLAFGVALGVTFLQLVPLPASLVETLHPAAYTSRVAAASIAGGEAPEWMPLTLDLGRTAAAFVSLMLIALTFLTASSLRTDTSARARLTIAVEVAALLVLFMGGLHELLGLDAIFGVYDASVDLARTPFLTTFVNPNHAAALFLLGAVVAFGASLGPDRSQRWHLGIGVVLGIGVLLTLSRANAMLLIVALLALTLPPLFLRRHRETRPQLVRLLVGAALSLFVGLVFIGPERWAAELATLGRSDLGAQGLVGECWRIGWRVATDAPYFGVGNGAFGLAASAHVGDWTLGLITYAHQGALQTFADLGLPGGIIVLLSLGRGFLVAMRRALRELPTWGAYIGLGVLALQNGVDFSLWLPGVGVPAAVVLGLVVQGTWPVTQPSERPPLRVVFSAVRWPLAASAVVGGLLAVAMPVAWRERPDGWRDDVNAALTSGRPADVDRLAMVTAHAHDFLAFDLAAALADKGKRPDEAWRYLERALVLAPTEPMTLTAAARASLARGDPGKAAELVERIDAQGDAGRGRALGFVLGAADAPNGKGLMERYFAGDLRRAIRASELLGERGDGEAARRLLAWALGKHADDPLAYEAFGARLGGDAERLGKLASECLARAADAADAAGRARWLRLGYYFEGRVQAVRGDDVQAWHLFQSAAAEGTGASGPLGNDKVGALLEAGKAAQRLGRRDWLASALEALSGLDVKGDWPEGELHMLRSHLAELDGDLTRAIRDMQQALVHLGHVPSYHERLAELFDKADDPTSADRARERARALSGVAHP